MLRALGAEEVGSGRGRRRGGGRSRIVRAGKGGLRPLRNDRYKCQAITVVLDCGSEEHLLL